MKRTSILARSITSLFLLLALILSITPTVVFASVAVASTTEISDQDVIKMSEALNMSTDSEVYDIGTNPYKIFDTKKEGFSGLFVNSAITDFKNYSFSGNSRAAISSEYSKERAYGAGLDINVPIYDVSANVDTNFQTNISSSLQTVNEEYYEYFERYQQTRVITTDWLSRDLTGYFSEAFINDLNKVNSVRTAVAFLEKYGTHVFDEYYMGGSLIITNYIVSEVSISEEYESNNKNIGLGAHISSAVSANANGSDYSIEGNNVSNTQTKSQMRMRARGGMNFNALTVNDLFTYKQEYFTGGGSGYIYSDWIKSLDSNQNEVVIDVAKPVAIWDLLDKSAYYDSARESLLQQAFDIMCYGNYSELCNENGVNSDIIGNVKYNANEAAVKFNITNDTIKLPSNITASFELGSTITNNESASNVTIKLDKDYDYARANNNQVEIDASAAGKSIVLVIVLHDEIIYNLNITIADNSSSYAGGYGTKDQPYLISTPAQWNAFVSSSDSYNKKTYYQLANDIDLNGKLFDVGGSGARVAFKGVLDGANHTISNFSVIAKSEWQNIGLIGTNLGTVKNLKIDNARSMNSGIISAENAEINAGVLIGENKGYVENVVVSNSSIRVTGKLSNSSMNVGVLCGSSIGDISSSGVTNCNLYGQSWKGEGVVNVGGVVGQVKLSNVTNCYAQNTKINALNQKSETASYTIGGVVGMVSSDESITSRITYCIAYDNTFNVNSGAFGYMAGKSSANNSFGNCYYESNIEKAVNSSSMNGCTLLRELTLANIGDAEFNKNWTQDANGNVILKLHAKEN